jgi:hypothetical protein
MFVWGYKDINQVIAETSNQIDKIEFGNRVGFFCLGFGILFIHILCMIEYFKPGLIRKYSRILNKFAIFIIGGLFVIGFLISNYTRNYVENAGYIHCRKAEDNIGLISKTLVYTKDMDICEAEVEKKKATRK